MCAHRRLLSHIEHLVGKARYVHDDNRGLVDAQVENMRAISFRYASCAHRGVKIPALLYQYFQRYGYACPKATQKLPHTRTLFRFLGYDEVPRPEEESASQRG